jgi:hypothetical protein
MVDEQVNIKSIPDTSISIGTQTPDEKQTESEPSENMEETQEPSLEQVYTIGIL